ncbi:MAG: ABC transporter transmembrane domain-containing protein [Caldilineales bacterium]
MTNRYRIRLMAYVGTKVVADVRINSSSTCALSLNFHNNYSVGRLMSRLIGDVGVMQEFITWSITGLARAVFLLVSILIAMLSLNWQLTLVTFLVMPLMIVLTNYWRKHVARPTGRRACGSR